MPAAEPTANPGLTAATQTEVIRLGRAVPGPKQVVAVPGTEVPLVTLDLPDRLRGQAREQVAQRQLADRTGQPATALALRPCLLPAAKGAAGERWTRVLTADPAWLEGLRQIPGRAVLPDYLTLPTAARVWTLAGDHLEDSKETPDILMARLGPEDGFSALPALAPLLLQRALETAAKPKALLLSGTLPSGTEDAVMALAATHDIPVARDIEGIAALGLPRPQALAHGELACDLRHNPMAARARLARRVLPWRWPILALLLAAALWAATQVMAIRRIEAETATLTAQTQALVQQHFIPDGPVLDVRLQVSQALADLRATSGARSRQPDPLELTGRAAVVIAAAGLRPDLLNWRAGEGLMLVLRLADFAAADQIAEALRAAGLAVEVADLRVSEGQSGVRGEFLLSHAADRPSQEVRP